MFTIDTHVPAPTVRASRAAITEVIAKMAPGESVLVPNSYRTSATNYAKRNGIKLVTKLENPAKTHTRIWRVAESVGHAPVAPAPVETSSEDSAE